MRCKRLCCLDQKVYSDAEAAKKKATRMSRELHQPIISYTCQRCGHHHIKLEVKLATRKQERRGSRG